jgi:hypothetical protein
VPTRIWDRDRRLVPSGDGVEALRQRLLLELLSDLMGRLHEPGTHLAGVVFGTPERHLSELVLVEPSGTEGLVRCQHSAPLRRPGSPSRTP